jgi:hypothetical protein
VEKFDYSIDSFIFRVDFNRSSARRRFELVVSCDFFFFFRGFLDRGPRDVSFPKIVWASVIKSFGLSGKF